MKVSENFAPFFKRIGSLFVGLRVSHADGTRGRVIELLMDSNQARVAFEDGVVSQQSLNALSTTDISTETLVQLDCLLDKGDFEAAVSLYEGELIGQISESRFYRFLDQLRRERSKELADRIDECLAKFDYFCAEEIYYHFADIVRREKFEHLLSNTNEKEVQHYLRTFQFSVAAERYQHAPYRMPANRYGELNREYMLKAVEEFRDALARLDFPAAEVLAVRFTPYIEEVNFSVRNC